MKTAARRALEGGGANFRFVLRESGSFRAARVEPQSERKHCEEGADRVKQGVVRRSSPAGHEGLMHFVETGIHRCDKPRGETPNPAPTGARAANSAKDEQAKNEILAEMRGLANEMVHELHGIVAEGGKKPVQQRADNARGVLGGERVCGKRKDHASPHYRWPPGTQPDSDARVVKPRPRFG